jgi:hemolysin activation/secretion protein
VFNFLGSGSLYGGILRYNACQKKGWFFDITGTIGQETSKITPTLFPTQGSDVRMDLLGVGVDLHRSNDMSNSFLRFNWVQNVGGSDQNSFWNSGTLTGARTNAEKDFAIYTTSAAHSRYMDTNKVHRVSGSFRWIASNDRLAPAKMTSFGGMYTVRGYHEYEIITDGGVLGTAQYEFDLVRYDQTKETGAAEAQPNRRWLKRLAPLAFVDYGNARMKNPVPGETGEQTLVSMGIGAIADLGENFSGAVHCGWPLKSTATTNNGDARLSVSLMMRW